LRIIHKKASGTGGISYALAAYGIINPMPFFANTYAMELRQCSGRDTGAIEWQQKPR
jgi:hypothetical protein